MINPHGGSLINNILTHEQAESIKGNDSLYKLKITNRTASDCEMIAIGGFSPIEGFMDEEQALSVINNMTLTDGLVWSIPILLPVSEDDYNNISESSDIALYDSYDRLIASMSVKEKFELDLDNYCNNVFKTNDEAHPGVKAVKNAGNKFLSGKIGLINRPIRENIDLKYFLDPSEVRNIIKEKGWKTVAAFQTRNPIHRAHEYLIKSVIEQFDGVLIHPLVGETKSDDIPADTRMACYEVLLDNYFNQKYVFLSVLPATMNYAGPREAIHHIIIRKNYGCSHMIVGRDHAGVGNYYGTYEA
ncbi:MAG: sulfate adenylyltransferase, partial [Candidatus Sericytochromatia bacterium]|nr:sulfate adenylyltransferase [Candidatus Sericytochromatia bacterium]